MSQAEARGVLYVVGTPIGNLEDITFRAVRVLGEADIIAAEDTRVTSKLLSRYEIDTRVVSFREQNAETAVPRLLEELLRGKNVALVADAGTPSVSDPGVGLVNGAREADLRVVPIPGPSALATAVSVAGMDGDGIRFVGFLPRRGKERSLRIDNLAAEKASVVLFEAPGRLRQTLEDLADPCGNRRAVVARELTKIHEELACGTMDELAAHFDGQVKGEVTIVIEGASTFDMESSEDEKRGLIRAELDRGRSAKDISTKLATGLGLTRREIYALTLDVLKKGS